MGPNIYAEGILHAYAAYSQSARAENIHEFSVSLANRIIQGMIIMQKIPLVAPELHLQVDIQPSQPILGREQFVPGIVISSFQLSFIQGLYILRKINVAMIIIIWYLIISRISIYSSSRTGSSIPASNILFFVFRGSSACLALSSGVTSSMSTLFCCSCSTMSPILSITRSLSIGADGSCSQAALLADTVPVAAAVAI